MKKIIIIFAVLVLIGVIATLLYMKKKENKILASERAVYNGLTRSEFTLKLQQAWREEWLKQTEKYILESADGRGWRDAIEAEMAKQGKDPVSLVSEVKLVALASWGKDNPKANSKQWSKAWLFNYVKNTMLVDPNKTEVFELMKTI